jgi:hypothetical protein
LQRDNQIAVALSADERSRRCGIACAVHRQQIAAPQIFQTGRRSRIRFHIVHLCGHTLKRWEHGCKFFPHALESPRIGSTLPKAQRGNIMSKGASRKPSARSLQNLKPPWQPGECPNPSGKNGSQFRPYSRAMEWLSAEELPEFLRLALNVRFKAEIRRLAGAARKHIPDIFPAKISWAMANALRLHLAALLDGDILASTECREAVEGRAPARVEFVSQNDKLEELLAAFRRAAAQPAIDDDAEVPKLVQ